MKATPIPSSIRQVARPLLALVALLAGSACTVSTIASRKQELPAIYSAAAPSEQKMMSQGWIDRGFTPAMVYIALGNPDKIVNTRKGTDEFWIYMNFDSSPASAAIGKGRVTVTQGGSGTSTSGSPATAININNRSNYSLRPDMGSTAPAEEIPRLYVHFRDGYAVGVEITNKPKTAGSLATASNP